MKNVIKRNEDYKQLRKIKRKNLNSRMLININRQ